MAEKEPFVKGVAVAIESLRPRDCALIVMVTYDGEVSGGSNESETSNAKSYVPAAVGVP